jgi:hypothetical protein
MTTILALPSLVVTAAVAVGPAHPPSGSSGSAAAATPIHVEVDVSALGPEGTGVDRLVLDALTPSLEAAGYTLSAAALADRAVNLRVRFEVLRLDRFDYGLHFELIDGDTVEPAIAWVACLGCMDAKLLPLLDEHTPALLDALARDPAALEDLAAGAAGESSAGVVEPSDPPADRDPQLARIGPLGYVGIAVGVLGLGASVGGAVELSRGRVVTPGDRGYAREGVDHRPAGIALISVGVAATVAGVAMLGVDLGRRAKQRRRDHGASAVVVPVPSPTGVSLGIVGKF